MVKLLANISLLFIGMSAYCQSNLNGIIKDSSDNSPLPYVNIGIRNKDVGTVSDNAGKFSLSLSEGYEQDSIIISSIGYQSQAFKISELIAHLSENNEISLEPTTILLPEIILTNKSKKNSILGNNTQTKTVKIGFTSNLLGNEIGVRLKIKKPTTLIEFNTFIVENEYDQLKFRLNVYNMKDGKPDQILLNKSILIDTNIKEGLLSVDLLPYNIVVEEDIVVCLEWIEDLGDKGLYFSGKLLGAPMYYRKVSQGIWEKSGTISAGFFVQTES